jgi:hypothetical protein
VPEQEIKKMRSNAEVRSLGGAQKPPAPCNPQC